MALQVSTSQAQLLESPDTTSDVKRRRSANYTPSIWGDHFLQYAASNSMEVDTKPEQHIQELKEEVKRMLMAPVNKSSEKLDMIDNIQRLGMSYHFKNEIHEVLEQVYNDSYSSEVPGNDDDLYTTALRFRLLRQQGYKVSCDIFNKFKETNCGFKEFLMSDVVGLLSLYEATHVRVHGEDVLDEAVTFTRTLLLESAHHRRLSSPLSKQVTHALYQPLWKGFQRIEARHYLSIYEEDDLHNETLLTLAKLDFNRVQKVHQNELSEITRWWKDLDFVNKLPFVRDRIVEAYFCALGVYFEPEYSIARMIVCKYVCLATTVDDIYDIHGTYEELELFTEAIERWDISAIEPLPKYMKVCYEALLNVYNDFEEKLASKGNSYRIHYAIEAFKYQVKAYFEEAKWLKAKHTPTMEEYISVEGNASFFTMATTSFVGMGALVTKDCMDWVFNDPKILKAASVIFRLLNDMVGHKFEQKREHHASSVECFMNQYSVNEEEAKIELTKQVYDSWKDLNQEWLELHSKSTIPKPLLLLILNLARLSELLYKHEDVFTHPKSLLKGFIISLFIEPVSV